MARVGAHACHVSNVGELLARSLRQLCAEPGALCRDTMRCYLMESRDILNC